MAGLVLHESGTYVRFTEAGAQLSATGAIARLSPATPALLARPTRAVAVDANGVLRGLAMSASATA
jgi:hypothetical protein